MASSPYKITLTRPAQTRIYVLLSAAVALDGLNGRYHVWPDNWYCCHSLLLLLSLLLGLFSIDPLKLRLLELEGDAENKVCHVRNRPTQRL